MSEINPISDLLEHHRALLEEADTDIEIANSKHREAMARLTQERDAVNATHQQALSDAVTRKMIAALEELVNGR
jgi:hypothetical protein